MAFSETDRTWIRRYLGFGATFLQAEPRVENAVTAVQSIADGGSRPDSSTENNIKGLIYGFAAVTGAQTGVTPGSTSTTGVVFSTPALPGLIQMEANIAALDQLLGVTGADEVKMDPSRETKRLCAEGRRLCHQLARMLGLKGVRANVFGGGEVYSDGDDPFSYSDLEHWRGGP